MLLAGRLVQLHWNSGADFERLAERQKVFKEVVPARPGEIVDRHGHIFATSVQVRSVYVVPKRIQQAWQLSQQLAEALHIDRDQLFTRIAAHPERQFLWVKRRITDDEVERVRALKLPVDSCGFRDEYRRLYPQGATAAQVIGLRDIDGVGRGGIEQSRQALLRGADGSRELVHDARGRVIEVRESRETPVRHGETIVLTLDAVIQVYAERALDQVMQEWKPKSASAIVLDPHTGDVLGMASRPTFDPNQPEQVAPEAWKCRPIADIYEPGSTFKPFVVAKALERGVIGRDEVFHCENGEYHMGRRVLHDHHKYGALSVADILVKSSNIGMAKIGQRLTNAGLYQTAREFGFGSPTGIELPGELGGMVRPLKKWNSYSTGSVPMGQEIAATPLQIVAAYAALCNGGRLISPHLVAESVDVKAESGESKAEERNQTPLSKESAFRLPLSIEHRSTSQTRSPSPPRGGRAGVGGANVSKRSVHSKQTRSPNATTVATVEPPKEASRVAPASSLIVSQAVSPDIADWIRREPLTAVVTRGTGKKAALHGYLVFGKTGTAQKLDPVTGEYSRQLHVSSFVCGAPADNPRVLVLISVDEPSVAHNGEHFGGSVAAPAAGELLRKVLKRLDVPPNDKLPLPTAFLPGDLTEEFLE